MKMWRTAVILPLLSMCLNAQPRDTEPNLPPIKELQEKLLVSEGPTVKALKAAAALITDARVAEEGGKRDEAERLLRQAIAIDEEAVGQEDASTLRDWGALAEFMERQSRLETAEQILKQNLDVVLSANTSHGALRYHQHTHDAFEDMVSFYERRQRFEDAEGVLKRFLTTYPAVYEAAAPYLDTRLACLYARWGRIEEADRYEKRVMEFAQQRAAKLGTPAEIARMKENYDAWFLVANATLRLAQLAEIYDRTGRSDKAEATYKNRVDIFQALAGPAGNPDLKALMELADFYERRGRYGQAVELMRQLIALREKQGANQKVPWRAEGERRRLAALYLQQRRYAEAEELQKWLVAAYEKESPDGSAVLTESIQQLAYIYAAQGRHADAEPHFRRAVEMARTLKGTRTLKADIFADLLKRFADNRIALGHSDEAPALYREAEQVLQAVVRDDGPYWRKSRLDVLSALGRSYHEWGRNEEAEPLARQALALSEKLSERDPRLVAAPLLVAASLEDLADILVAQRRHGEIEQLYLRSLAIREKMRGHDHPETIELRAKLAVLGNATAARP